jgi:bifunctional DNA-binding transcriptional regulator/antitoxin component of YhaV-PrlF toxin-antitoxin module
MITTVEYDEFHDEYYLVIPDEILNELKWKVGDTLVWTVYGYNKVALRKYDPSTIEEYQNEK